MEPRVKTMLFYCAMGAVYALVYFLYKLARAIFGC